MVLNANLGTPPRWDSLEEGTAVRADVRRGLAPGEEVLAPLRQRRRRHRNGLTGSRVGLTHISLAQGQRAIFPLRIAAPPGMRREVVRDIKDVAHVNVQARRAATR